MIAKFFVLLAALVSFSSFSETIPATSVPASDPVYGFVGENNVCYSTGQAACASNVNRGDTWFEASPGLCRRVDDYAAVFSMSGCIYTPQLPSHNECPTGQNWTLSGTSCTRPDCQSGESRGVDGTCSSVCTPKTGTQVTSKCGTANTNQRDSDGCTVTPVSVTATRQSDGSNWYCGTWQYTGDYNGVAGTPTADTTPNPAPSPPCPAGWGVMTSGDGTVKCVQPGTPSASDPKVTSSSTNKTNSDGSTTKTTITQTCTGDGACSSTTTTTNTGVGGSSGAGATAGQAGTPGTTTETKDKQGESFCAQNPSLQVCKGGMNEEATQKSIETEIKKLTTPTDPSELSADAKSAVDAQFDAKKTTIDGIAADGLSMKGVIFNWQTPELQAACAPWLFNVGGYHQTIDACPTIYKIRDIAGYVLYFLTALTLGWILFAGGKQA